MVTQVLLDRLLLLGAQGLPLQLERETAEGSGRTPRDGVPCPATGVTCSGLCLQGTNGGTAQRTGRRGGGRRLLPRAAFSPLGALGGALVTFLL